MVGNYVLGARLGAGGTSEVYAGEHRFLSEPVAVKLFGAGTADAGFVTEARRTRAIAHRNVVRVVDCGLEGEVPYIVMERIAGESLAARLRERGPLDEAAVRRLGAGIADGLAAAHALGIVHCDLKPANVMLAGDEPKVVDFGIARHVTQVASAPRMGTPAYMAPEQRELVTPAVDCWALGMLLVEALTGKLDRGSLPCSPALAVVIDACLDREPARRPAMAVIAGALRGDPDERITEPLADAPGPTPPPRRRWVPIAGGLAVAAVAVIAIWQLAGGRTSEASQPSPPVTAGKPSPAPAPAPTPTPTPKPPSITVRSTPPGAAIMIDGKTVGRTPATLERPLPVDLELRRHGYRRARVRATEAGALDVELVPVPRPMRRDPQEPLD
jgi:eukaryotic-like serine/threonine-protein kinase